MYFSYAASLAYAATLVQEEGLTLTQLLQTVVGVLMTSLSVVSRRRWRRALLDARDATDAAGAGNRGRDGPAPG